MRGQIRVPDSDTEAGLTTFLSRASEVHITIIQNKIALYVAIYDQAHDVNWETEDQGRVSVG